MNNPHPLSSDADSILLYIYIYIYGWVWSKEVSSTIFKVFGMTWPGIEPRSPELLVNPLLVNSRPYKVRIKGKVKQSGKGVRLLQHLSVVVIEKEAFRSPSTKVANFTLLRIYIYIYKLNKTAKIGIFLLSY